MPTHFGEFEFRQMSEREQDEPINQQQTSDGSVGSNEMSNVSFQAHPPNLAVIAISFQAGFRRFFLAFQEFRYLDFTELGI
jgi:hypothetical protein